MRNMNLAVPTDRLDWIEVCALAEITPNTGVCALIDGQQIAIFRVGQEQRVYALSNQDPFSQAAVMSRGILGDLQSERVVASPMYKQHFSLTTGRCLEDSQYRLQVFPSKVVQGKVWVCAQAQKTYMSRPLQQPEKLKLVMVGHSVLGQRCLEDILQLAPERYQISVIAAEFYANDDWVQMLAQLSTDQPSELPDEQANGPLQDMGVTPQVQWIADSAIRIDRVHKQVLTQSGQRIDYDRLILATGSKAALPNITGIHVDGMDVQGVFSLSNIRDVQHIFAYTAQRTAVQHACVVGSGIVAVATADALKRQGLQVTLLCSEQALLEQHLDACTRWLIQQRLQQCGITVQQLQLQSLHSQQGQLKQLQLSDGTGLAVDLLVFATAMLPNIELAQQAGLQCQQGILVNDTMQSFDPTIYAIGDCTQHRGQCVTALEPLWGQAFVCASHLAEHGQVSYQASSPVARFSLMGCEVFSVGNVAGGVDCEDIIHQ